MSEKVSNLAAACFSKATMTKDNELKSKKEAELEGKYKQITAEKESLQKLLDREKQTNSKSQVSWSLCPCEPCYRGSVS